jgi:dTDP-4-amino-4,6-dideoxygalactose transaminase
LPPVDLYIDGVRDIWKKNQITNGGDYSKKLAYLLSQYFSINNISLYANATLALIACLKSLDMRGGEIITTPFTFAATAQSIIWANHKPVFVDIEPNSLNISVEAALGAISSETVCIMPVHVFGNIVDLSIFRDEKKSKDLKIVVDAAHAFSNQKSFTDTFKFADASVLSLHATKLFNSVEGGAIISQDISLHKKLERFKNFGLDAAGESVDLGFNAKMSELHALMGVVQFDYIEKIHSERKIISDRYIRNLQDLESITLINNNNKNNKSYFPILVQNSYNSTRDELFSKLLEHGINARKYFYPLVSNMESIAPFAKYGSRLENAQYVSEQILCLPMYNGLSFDDIDKICDIIINI